MIKIYDSGMRLTAILQNAFKISYEKRLNEIWTASFSLPADDPKNEECLPFRFVEVFDGSERVDLFRIVPEETSRTNTDKTISYQCEHVLATLMDDVMFKYHERVGLGTSAVLQYILGFQGTNRWVLGQVDFQRFFSYKWENDNLLGSLLSVPKPFIEDWQLTWHTETYPWTIDLIEPDTSVTTYIRHRKNLRGIKRHTDPSQICTRLYPLGYGEGINQLGIEKVNPTGLPYVEDAAAIAKYGIISRVWTDRRYEHADSLFGASQAMLNELKEPYTSYQIDAADLYLLSNDSVDKFNLGAYVRAIDEELGIDITTRVVILSKPDVKANPADIKIEIANKAKDVAGTIAELADRQRINDVYAQGATNLDSHDFADNCDPNNPAVIKFYLPVETVRVNKMILSFDTVAFRAYSKAIQGGGAQTVTSKSGGRTVTSSDPGVWTLYPGQYLLPDFMNYSGSHNHGISSGTELATAGGGSVSFVQSGDHAHSMYSVAHKHDVTVPDHTHDITLPGHTHAIDYGIYNGPTPTKVTVKVDGNTIPNLGLNTQDVDIIPYLSKDGGGRIKRGDWHEITITPDSLGRIVANVVTQLFVQSRGGGDY